MDSKLDIIVTICSYVAGAWIAFKIYDFKMKGRKDQNELLFLGLLLVFAAGGGTLLAYVLKSMFGAE